ncbi:MAG TPA: hypothetical protein VNB90_10950 [Cytophagaceae bacterium]|nr:hypothetical protein [Cytophagaceae bacterium]
MKKFIVIFSILSAVIIFSSANVNAQQYGNYPHHNNNGYNQGGGYYNNNNNCGGGYTNYNYNYNNNNYQNNGYYSGGFSFGYSYGTPCPPAPAVVVVRPGYNPYFHHRAHCRRW